MARVGFTEPSCWGQTDDGLGAVCRGRSRRAKRIEIRSASDSGYALNRLMCAFPRGAMSAEEDRGRERQIQC